MATWLRPCWPFKRSGCVTHADEIQKIFLCFQEISNSGTKNTVRSKIPLTIYEKYSGRRSDMNMVRRGWIAHSSLLQFLTIHSEKSEHLTVIIRAVCLSVSQNFFFDQKGKTTLLPPKGVRTRRVFMSKAPNILRVQYVLEVQRTKVP